MKKILITAATSAAFLFAVAGPASADETEPPEQQEFQCSPGILGTGILCNQAPAPGPAPEDDVFQGGPLGADSELAELLGGLLG